ncbi:hypothetical protein CDAR_194541 [Caerostris darwini]|uniref:Secreted protein n=1 Tax=Caerostris darwini TaxID=1538125 RepID=A0AAV4X939_9ARAC|nr:hypothetical protein CDAR_194541 [Caerostris darwini]
MSRPPSLVILSSIVTLLPLPIQRQIPSQNVLTTAVGTVSDYVILPISVPLRPRFQPSLPLLMSTRIIFPFRFYHSCQSFISFSEKSIEQHHVSWIRCCLVAGYNGQTVGFSARVAAACRMSRGL